ncbi:MAG: glycosyltransferase family 9 protein [Minisyncoccia bacterium]
MRRYRSLCYFNSGAIGEFLMMLYFADLLERSAKTLGVEVPQVDIVVQRNAALVRELAACYPNVRIIELSRKSIFRTILQARRGSLPRMFITQQTFGKIPLPIKCIARLSALGPGRYLGGFDDHMPVNRFLYNERWEFDTARLFPETMHWLAEHIGYPTNYVAPRLKWPEQPFPESKTRPIVLHVCAQGEKRSLPLARWKVLIAKLRGHYPKATFAFTGSGADREFIDAAIEGIRDCENSAGKISITESIALLKSARLFIGVDTGITHLAAFLGCRGVVLGNNSNPCWSTKYCPSLTWLAADGRCTCLGNKKGDCTEYVDGKPYYRCLLDISDESIIAAADAILAA